MQIAIFTFNPFQENTYVLYDETKEAVIVDPGCLDKDEELQLVDFITSNKLIPKHLVNTHCHIDHVLGNEFVSKKYNLPLTAHKGEKVVLDAQPQVSKMYGIPYKGSPDITKFLAEGDVFKFGKSELEIIFAPGHSPAHICLLHKKSNQLIAGDVLFRDSIGRTDLPGGDHKTLIDNIKSKLLVLNDDLVVYPGHGPSTTIGYERKNNPFLT